MHELVHPGVHGKTHFVAAGVFCLLAFAAAWVSPHPLVLVLAAMAPIAAAFCVRRPFMVCLLFIGFSFFRLHEAFPSLMPLHLPSVFAFLTIGSLTAMLVSRRATIAWTYEIKLFAAFFAVITLGIVFSSGRTLAFAYWTDTFLKIAVMVFAIASMCRNPDDFGLTMRVLVTCGAVVACVALNNSWNGQGLVEGTRVTIGRDFQSVLGDPNDLALVLLFPLSFALGLAGTPGVGRWSRLLGVIGGILLAGAVLATQSRGGMLGMLAVAAVFVLRARGRQKIWLLAGTALPALLFVVHALADRVGSARSGDAIALGSDESSMGRLNMWWMAVRMAADHPLTGVGLNNFRANNFAYNQFWDGLARAVHSTWFAVLSEGGIIAFALFIWMVVAVARRVSRAARTLSPEGAGSAHDPVTWALARGLLGGLVGFAVSGTFLTQGFTWPFYILLALTVSLGRHADMMTKTQDGLAYA